MLLLSQTAETVISAEYRCISYPSGNVTATKSSDWLCIGSLRFRRVLHHVQPVQALGGLCLRPPCKGSGFPGHMRFSPPGSMKIVTPLESSPRLLSLPCLCGGQMTAQSLGVRVWSTHAFSISENRLKLSAEDFRLIFSPLLSLLAETGTVWASRQRDFGSGFLRRLIMFLSILRGREGPG